MEEHTVQDTEKERVKKHQRKQKVLHIVTKGSPFGGAQKYVYTLATTLPPTQFESVVVVGRGTELPDLLASKHIRVITISDMGRDIQLAEEFISFFKLLHIIYTEEPDIVHLNSSKVAGLGAVATFLVRMIRLISRGVVPPPRTILTVHGWAFNEKRPWIAIQIIRLLSWITVLFCNQIIVISKSEAVQAVNMPFIRHKTNVIYNGVSPIDFKTRDEARAYIAGRMIEHIHTITPETVWLGTIAELHKNKNIPATIEAVQKLISKTDQKIICVIIGEGEERAYLEKYIRQKNVTNTVFLVGKIEHASIYLKAFDIFLLPSIKEGLPYTLLEAGLAGLPCLSTYVGGIPEIIRNNTSGILVDPPTGETIADGLLTILENQKTAEEFGDKLKEKVEKDFSMKQMIDDTIEVYRK